MAIIVDRASGEIRHAQKLDQQKVDALWAKIVRAYAIAHPKELQESAPKASA